VLDQFHRAVIDRRMAIAAAEPDDLPRMRAL
jgi:hypothetical protein